MRKQLIGLCLVFAFSFSTLWAQVPLQEHIVLDDAVASKQAAVTNTTTSMPSDTLCCDYFTMPRSGDMILSYHDLVGMNMEIDPGNAQIRKSVWNKGLFEETMIPIDSIWSTYTADYNPTGACDNATMLYHHFDADTTHLGRFAKGDTVALEIYLNDSLIPLGRRDTNPTDNNFPAGIGFPGSWLHQPEIDVNAYFKARTDPYTPSKRTVWRYPNYSPEEDPQGGGYGPSDFHHDATFQLVDFYVEDRDFCQPWVQATLNTILLETDVRRVFITGPPNYETLFAGEDTRVGAFLLEDDYEQVTFPDTLLNLYLGAYGATLGTLIGVHGEQANMLSEVRAEEAASGNITYATFAGTPELAVDPKLVTITAELVENPNVAYVDSFFVGGHTFDITVAPDTVALGKTGILTITAIDQDSTEVPLPDDTRLYLESFDNLLIDPDSSTVGWYLEDITYGDARTGKLRFLSADSSQVDMGVTEWASYVYVDYYHEGTDSYFSGLDYVPSYAPYDLTLKYDKDPKTYLPLRDDLIKVTAKIFPEPPAGSMVTFDLVQADDFIFADSTDSPKEVAVMGDSAVVSLRSQEYWGVVTVKATFSPPDEEDVEDEKQLPIDTDADGIADVWELDAANGGSLALGGSDQDGNWDEETSPGNSNDGDGFTKLGEYQGVLVGDDHMRMTPEKKEVFFDVHLSSAGAWAVGEVERQIGLKVYLFEGLAPTGLYPGSQNIKYLGVNFVRGQNGMVFVQDEPHLIPSPSSAADSVSNGIVVQNVYTLTGSLMPQSGPIQSGLTNSNVHSGGGRSRTFVQTINNIWHDNYIPESAHHTFLHPVVEAGGTPLWESLYNNSDLNNGNGTNDSINPFDLLSPKGSPNDAIDLISAGFTEQQYIELVTLHEIGHALGMDTYSTPVGIQDHPLTGASPMRSGWGPSRVVTFTIDDIKQVQLK